jgi:hypothetical protein
VQLHESAGPKYQDRCQVGAPSHFLPILTPKLVFPLKIIQLGEKTSGGRRSLPTAFQGRSDLSVVNIQRASTQVGSFLDAPLRIPRWNVCSTRSIKTAQRALETPWRGRWEIYVERWARTRLPRVLGVCSLLLLRPLYIRVQERSFHVYDAVRALDRHREPWPEDRP